MKIEVIGDVDTVMGFKLAGVPGHIAQNSTQAEKIIKELIDDSELALVIITEILAEKNRELINEITENSAISFVEIPDSKGKKSGEKVAFDQIIKRAVGFDIKY